MQLRTRSEIWSSVDLASSIDAYYVALAVLTTTLISMSRLMNRPFGQCLQGIRENETRMSALGHPVMRIKLTAFTVSGALAGLAGVLLVNQTAYVSPSMLQWSQSGVLLVMVIIGGVGRLYGGVVGAVVFLLVEEVLLGFTEYWQIALGILLMTIVLVAPHGLLGLINSRLRQ